MNFRFATALVSLTSATFFAFACSSNTPPKPSISPTGSSPTVAAASLDKLLLSAEQVSTAMSTTGMAVGEHWDETTDPQAGLPNECLPIQGAVEDAVYKKSGWTAIRGEYLSAPKPAAGDKKYAEQSVVFFPVTRSATDFFDMSAHSWPACSNRSYTFSGADGSPVTWTVGPVANNNGMLTASRTKGGSAWTCQRAFTVNLNIAIDIMTCSHNKTDPAAANIARQIAANVARQ